MRVCAAVFAGCGEVPKQSDAGIGRRRCSTRRCPTRRRRPQEVARVPVTANRDIDLLFVVDNSPSTLDKQTNLKNAFPVVHQRAQPAQGGLPNVHLGVVTPDLGTQGRRRCDARTWHRQRAWLVQRQRQGGQPADQRLEVDQRRVHRDIKNTDGTRTMNYSGTLANAFSAMASVGAAGCGFEQPLQAAKNALDNNPANAGFLRPAASLAIM